MKIDKALFDKAVLLAMTRGMGLGLETNRNNAQIIQGNKTVRNYIGFSMEKLKESAGAALGTMFEVGFEAGLVYHELMDTKGEGDDKGTDARNNN